jgi:hypothetical protein
MSKVYSIIILILFLFSVSKGSNPDSLSFTCSAFDTRIKSVQLYRQGWNLSYPVMKLGSDDKMELHFDLVGDQGETYYYTFIHCDKDWNQSDIFINDYLEGFPENQIEDFKPSFNTTVNYIHYSLVFPNDRVNISLSGNYIIKVYPVDNPDKPALTYRFIVTEEAASIEASAHRPQMTSDNNAGQQIDFTVNIKSIKLSDAYSDIYSFVLQNGRWDNAKTNLKPDFFSNNQLKYNTLSDKIIFNGGNEYRYFDIKSIRYLSEFISRIDFVVPFYNVQLKTSENREFSPYFYWQDFNGKYYIASTEGRDYNTDADYVNVFFTLPSKYPVDNGRIFVSGGLTMWQCNDNNLMVYNPVKEQYECNMLLKQGWYNYEFVYLKNGDKNAVASLFEGSHYETENDYLIIVYYRNPRERYDRVIASSTINTLNKLTY